MNRRRADLSTAIWTKKPAAPKPLSPADLADRVPRRVEINRLVTLARERSEADPASSDSVLLFVLATVLAEIAASEGIRSLDRGGPAKPPEPAPETGTPMERFIAAMEAATDRALADGLHPPNVAAVLRAEADRAEREKQ